MNNVIALSNDDIRTMAPSVLAQRPSEEVSDRYGFVPTINVVDALRKEGWVPVDAGQTQVRRPDQKMVTRHMLRFRNPEAPLILNDAAPELILFNSHNRSHSYTLSAGLYRFVCANGLVIADSVFKTIRVRHNENALDNVIEGSYEVLDAVPGLAASVERMAAVNLDKEMSDAFAMSALQMRYDDLEAAPISFDQLLNQHRAEDAGSDLWRVMNRVQENLVRGGLVGVSENGRRIRTQPIRNLKTNAQINQDLWGLAESTAELLAA